MERFPSISTCRPVRAHSRTEFPELEPLQRRIDTSLSLPVKSYAGIRIRHVESCSTWFCPPGLLVSQVATLNTRSIQGLPPGGRGVKSNRARQSCGAPFGLPCRSHSVWFVPTVLLRKFLL